MLTMVKSLNKIWQQVNTDEDRIIKLCKIEEALANKKQHSAEKRKSCVKTKSYTSYNMGN